MYYSSIFAVFSFSQQPSQQQDQSTSQNYHLHYREMKMLHVFTIKLAATLQIAGVNTIKDLQKIKAKKSILNPF